MIFYTAGYRYNAKKHDIERSGSLIVDTLPKGANVYLDGSDTHEISPITFQNISPGWHEISLQKPGYHTWHHVLDVRAEQVTFANNVWLWKKSTPTLIHAGNMQQLRTDPTNSRMAVIFQQSSSSALAFFSADAGWEAKGLIHDLAVTSSTIIRWREDGQAFVVNGLSPQDKAWWGTVKQSPLSIDALPDGMYHWSQDELMGNSDDRSFRLDPDRNTFIRDVLATTTISMDRDITISTTHTSPNLLLTYKAFQTRLFSLPLGKWRINALRHPFVLLQDRQRWLALALNSTEPFITQLEGDDPRWLESKRIPHALFLNHNELWEWSLEQEPRLLWRQSEPLIQATWHRSGRTVFVATQHEVIALNIDPEQSVATVPLAKFDKIHAMDVLDGNLLISGTRDGIQGLWSLPIE